MLVFWFAVNGRVLGTSLLLVVYCFLPPFLAVPCLCVVLLLGFGGMLGLLRCIIKTNTCGFWGVMCTWCITTTRPVEQSFLSRLPSRMITIPLNIIS